MRATERCSVSTVHFGGFMQIGRNGRRLLGFSASPQCSADFLFGHSPRYPRIREISSNVSTSIELRAERGDCISTRDKTVEKEGKESRSQTNPQFYPNPNAVIKTFHVRFHVRSFPRRVSYTTKLCLRVSRWSLMRESQLIKFY